MIKEVYPPSEDTFFFAKHLKQFSGKTALEIGTGNGTLAKILAKNFSFVVATDINFYSLFLLKNNISNLICCDSAFPINSKFDLIVCNFPYLPSKKIEDPTTDGGIDGIEIPLKIFSSVEKKITKDGKFIFLTSSLANFEKLFQKIEEKGFKIKIVSKLKLFFEELLLIEVKKS